ncbi:YceI family protein [Maricaulis sp.]|jgi:cytochrome b561|uniref:YceI family protein n=1 Tax=Maricaulis sp. TaxID=1486257 RepID=UPI0026029754|nr:YceI family protein [Maricaulis sp.]
MLRYAFFLAPALIAAPVVAQDWTVDHGASSVGFETTVSGGSVNGTFSDWSAEIVLDPDNLEGARIDARVMTATGSTGNTQMDQTMLSNSGLNPVAHEAATFLSEDIRATDNGYQAHGTLTIAGTAQDIVLPFTLDIADGRAIADSRYTLARTDYGVGSPSWGSAAAEVTLILHVEANAAQ